ncbi:hypothetical protein ACE193_20140 [Bernardetia sp. OM2101]|uniref:virginiamycin B lyase family protein n=1 Tax=Bernardetia sp. OM2101 TaxID=3344876 RepID=UPI0035D1318C
MMTSKSIFNNQKIKKNSLKIWLSLLICALIFISFTACKKDSDPEPEVIEEPDTPDVPDTPTEPTPLDSSTFIAAISKLEDVSDNGNASDISIAFSIPNALDSIDLFRVIIVKSENTNQVTLNSIKNLNAGSYFEIDNTGKEYSLTLPATLKTFGGQVIEEGQNYKAVVLSKGAFNNEEVELLSDFSEEFILSSPPQIQVTTLVNRINANDGVSVDAEGNIYTSNYGQNAGREVLKITPSGDVSTFVDGLQGPLGNAMDSQGNFYVAHKNTFAEGTITKIAPNGTRTDVAVLSGYIAGIKLDADDNLYVTNYLQGRIDKITPEGAVSVFVSDPLLAGGVGIDFDEDGNIWVGNYINGDILKVTPAGEVTKIATIPTTVNNNVIGYITYLNGFVYATALGENRIYKVSPNGMLEQFAGNGTQQTKDGDLLEAAFAAANGIASDKVNNILYITQATTNKFALRKIQL